MFTSLTIFDELASIFDPLEMHHTHFHDLLRNVLITGAAQLAVWRQLFVSTGAKTVIITDINDYRLNLAKPRADVLVNPTQNSTVLKDLTPKQFEDWS